MQMDLGFLVINIVLMITILLMAIGYTFARTGQTFGWPGKTRFAMFGVFSFVMIGMLFISYMGWLYITTGFEWDYIVNVGQQEFDFSNGFFTVAVGAFFGLSLGLFALLKKQEAYGK